MITSDAFLEALNLPSEHPFIPHDASELDITDAAPREWSFSNYLQSSSSLASKSLASSNDCTSDFPLPSWAVKQTGKDICNSVSAPTATGPDDVGFLEEIAPCLVSTCHMLLILLAPIILLICLRRLTTLPSNQRGNQRTPDRKSKRAEAGYIDALSFFSIPTKIFSRANSQDDAAMRSPTGGYFTYIVALFFSAFIMIDPMYVLEFSQVTLVTVHLLIISIGMKRHGAKVAMYTAVPITAIAFYIMAHQDLNLPPFAPGLYYDKNNTLISTTVSKWPVDKRTYDDGRGTPWMMTGDTRTGLPFMFYKIPEINFQRRWIPLKDENEALILDIAFPSNNVIESDKRVYLVLHGINGNSHEGYVADFIDRQVKQGNIVAVLVSRGMGDSLILGDNILHFARTKDVAIAARALKSAIRQVSEDDNPLLLSGLGFSMGAITLANYVAKAGARCDLDAAVAISGALDTREQPKFLRSASLWQPFITKALRDALLSSFGKQIQNRLTGEQLKESIKAASLVDFDRKFFVPYHDFDGLDDYYSRLGAMGDFVSFDDKVSQGRIANISIPLLMVHSLDDPIGYWGTYHSPDKVVHTGKGNTVVLFTRTGGHVGWPLGWNPSLEAWKWMSDVASSFTESVDMARRNINLLN